MLKRAIKGILEDASFHIEPAATALHTAMEWACEHEDRVHYLESQICSALHPCLSGRQTLAKGRREAMWRAYHKVRTSEQFKLLWNNLLAEMKVQSAVPAFYQAVTDAIFKEMIVIETPVEEAQLPPV